MQFSIVWIFFHSSSPPNLFDVVSGGAADVEAIEAVFPVELLLWMSALADVLLALVFPQFCERVSRSSLELLFCLKIWEIY